MSLVEVLVALLVLSVGMLGVAVLFVQSVRGSRTALLRTQAVNLVSDMSDRIRANATAAGAYDTTDFDGSGAGNNCAPEPSGDEGRNCTPENLAKYDLAKWTEAVKALPGADANPPTIQYFPGDGVVTPDRYRITVTWHEANQTQAEQAGETLTYHSDVVLMRRLPVVAGVAP
ncbi:MAG TPA: type IV pilus modification protein PilV [Steroidobacteraceae bacterium]|nr:type IV pilus modification protein PilV [Steroidobacteraceae bacterium]